MDHGPRLAARAACQSAESLAALDLALDVGRVEQVEPLGVGRLVVALGLQACVAGGASEHLEELAGDAAVGELDGAVSLGDEGEGLGDGARVALAVAGDPAQGVDEHLGVEPPHDVVREELLGVAVLAARDRRLLVGAGVEDQAIEVPQVVVGLDQLALEVGQQPGVRGRVVGSDVVGLVDDPAAQEPGPHAVDDAPREPRVLRRDQPVGEHAARVLTRRDPDPHAVGQDRLQRRRRRRVQAHDLLLPLRRALVADAREEGRQARLPRLRQARHAGAHERQGHRPGDGRRLLALDRAVEVDGRHAEVAPARRQQRARELVVGRVRPRRLAEPPVVGLHRVGPQVDRELRLDPQQVAPLQRPVVGEGLALQQRLDHLRALARVPRLEEPPDRRRLRQRARHVQVHPPEEHRVGADPRGPDAAPPQRGRHQRVDGALRQVPRLALEGANGPRRPSLTGSGRDREHDGEQHWLHRSAMRPKPRVGEHGPVHPTHPTIVSWRVRGRNTAGALSRLWARARFCPQACAVHTAAAPGPHFSPGQGQESADPVILSGAQRTRRISRRHRCVTERTHGAGASASRDSSTSSAETAAYAQNDRVGAALLVRKAG